jgi:hypothetical protein
MAQTQEVWWRPEGRSPFALDPAKPAGPQIIAAIGQFGIIFGGPALGLVAIDRYPFLIPDRVIYIGGLGSILSWFAASFAFFPDKSLPKGMPMAMKLAFRVGFGLCATFLVLGLVGIANGYATPVVERTVAVVAKHETLQRDPSHRTYYVAIRAWPDSRAVVELGAPRAVYDRLDVPITAIDTPGKALEAMPDAAHVRLEIGQGRFGQEWLAAIRMP